MFPHTVTLYNVLSNTDPATLEESTKAAITILRGVLLDAQDGASVSPQGYGGAAACTLYIPFSVDAADGMTGSPKRFAAPAAFGLAADKSGLWTLTTDGKAFFVKGEAVGPGKSLEELKQLYDGVYTVAAAHTRDYGTPDMHHWEVGAC